MIKGYLIAILAAGLIGSVAIYVGTAERNRALVQQYEAETATYLQTIEHQGEQIRALNERIKANNVKWLELVQAEAKRVQAAQAEAEQIRRERDQITQELIKSRQAWREAVANDETLAEFVRIDVPAAVWQRLCIASGSAACG